MKTIKLPKQYQYIEGQSRPEYKKYDGWQKISYSQFTSFKDYRAGYIQNYFLGNASESGIFAEYGSSCGNYLNPYDTNEYELLSAEDIAVLESLKQNHPKNADFEYEILIDLEPFGLEKTCVQAFTDRQHLTDEGLLDILDYKTLTIKTKKAYYESDEYMQLGLYAFGLEELGFKIGRTSVTGLGRLGNTTEQGNKNVLRLSGEIIEIEKTYDRKKVILAIKEIMKNCNEICEYFSVFNLFFGKK